jgi:toxin ParE1/3/4
MSNYSIDITEPAENDMRNIGLYISKELLEPDIAIKTINKIGNTIFSLEEFPFRNALVADERLAKQSIRKIIIDNYIVFYMAKETLRTVTILRILYSKRDWVNLL